ncbi:MAG TPA: hypothetical protein VFT95_22705 [Micromonosporaceae bacterium]|nr:hypothetical protein [Micromonosporaceae bacterium]
MAVRTRPEFGDGPLSRAAALVYTLLVVEALLLATTAPGLVALLLLDRDASNAPLAALCAVPVGPALSAALYALHRRSRDVADLHPAAAFWRGYRANAWDALRVWAPWLAWLAVVAVGRDAMGAAAAWWATLLALVAVSSTLWVANALVISSLFAFRGVDVARLAAYFLVRTPGVTLGTAGLVIAAGAVVLLSSEAVLALLGSLLAAALLRTARPMTDAVREEFVA